MAQEPDGLFGVMADLAKGKSITLPGVEEIELHALLDRHRRIEREERDSVDERFHGAVAGSL